MGLASLAAAFALGAFAADVPPSARALAACVAVYALAPLFAPVPGRRRAAALMTILAWCAALALLAAGLATAAGAPGALPALVATFLAMTLASHLLLVALAHGLVAEQGARWILFTAQALALSAPLWLAPLAELRGGGSDLGARVIASSPLSHLASAAGCDYLRTEWFYRHSALGGMRFEYPTVTTVLAVYATLAAVLAFFTSRPLQEQTR